MKIKPIQDVNSENIDEFKQIECIITFDENIIENLTYNNYLIYHNKLILVDKQTVFYLNEMYETNIRFKKNISPEDNIEDNIEDDKNS